MFSSIINYDLGFYYYSFYLFIFREIFVAVTVCKSTGGVNSIIDCSYLFAYQIKETHLEITMTKLMRNIL